MGMKMVRVMDGRRKNMWGVKRTRERARARVREGGKDRERGAKVRDRVCFCERVWGRKREQRDWVFSFRSTLLCIVRHKNTPKINATIPVYSCQCLWR